MLSIDVINDEELQGVVKLFLSSLLPHENYSDENYSENLSTLLSFIKQDEFRMEYRLLVNALCEMNKIKISFPNYSPRLERESFSSLIEISIPEAVVRVEYGVEDWLKFEGLNSNLKMETVKESACQKLYSRAMQLYDDCFSMAVDSTSVVNHRPELKAAFLSHVSVQCVNTQSSVLRHEARVGRKRYRGITDWLDYTSVMLAEIKDRLRESEEEKTVCIDTVEGSLTLLKELKNLFIPIAKYGIPEIDQYTPILRHRLVVVVGKENVGKTKFAIDKAVNALLEGAKIVYMCGETQKAKVFADIVINYTFKKYGLILRPEHVGDPEGCPEEVQKILGIVINDVVSSKLILCDSFNYATCYDELRDLYDKYKFDLCVIDHSCALVGTVGDGSLSAKVAKLADDVKNFRKQYPVCIMVTSHPSTTAKNTDSRGKETTDSPTKGSQNLSTDADEVFIIRDNPTLQKQGLVILENTKRRDAGRITDYVLLRKKFEVSAFIYDPAEQNKDNALTVEKEEAIRLLEESYSDEDEYSL